MSTCNRHKARGENLPLCFYESEEHSSSAKRRQCQSRTASRSSTVRETMGHLPTSWQYQVANSKVPTAQPCNLRCWDSWGIIGWLRFRPAEQQLFWSGYKPGLTECRQQNILTLLPLYNVSRFAASF